jgi:hypothetical protein
VLEGTACKNLFTNLRAGLNKEKTGGTWKEIR